MEEWSVGRRIKELREEKGIRRSDLARLVGISEWQVAELEGGRQRPTTKMLLRIAEALLVKPVRFFEESWERN